MACGTDGGGFFSAEGEETTTTSSPDLEVATFVKEGRVVVLLRSSLLRSSPGETCHPSPPAKPATPCGETCPPWWVASFAMG